MVRDADLQSTLFNNELMMTANCDDDCYISHKKEVYTPPLAIVRQEACILRAVHRNRLMPA